jgi:hypothetical protein
VVIYRLAPGELAPWGGTYRLVGHYGERTDRAVAIKAGEQLPLIEIDSDAEMWFVLEDEPREASNAA